MLRSQPSATAHHLLSDETLENINDFHVLSDHEIQQQLLSFNQACDEFKNLIEEIKPSKRVLKQQYRNLDTLESSIGSILNIQIPKFLAYANKLLQAPVLNKSGIKIVAQQIDNFISSYESRIDLKKIEENIKNLKLKISPAMKIMQNLITTQVNIFNNVPCLDFAEKNVNENISKYQKIYRYINQDISTELTQKKLAIEAMSAKLNVRKKQIQHFKTLMQSKLALESKNTSEIKPRPFFSAKRTIDDVPNDRMDISNAGPQQI